MSQGERQKVHCALKMTSYVDIQLDNVLAR
jgi:hypothetical protein